MHWKFSSAELRTILLRLKKHNAEKDGLYFKYKSRDFQFVAVEIANMIC